jgi:hypothetical protein
MCGQVTLCMGKGIARKKSIGMAASKAMLSNLEATSYMWLLST